MAHLLKNIETFIKNHGLTVCAGFMPRAGVLADAYGVAVYDYEVCPRGLFVELRNVGTGEVVERLPPKVTAQAPTATRQPTANRDAPTATRQPTAILS